MKDFYVSLTRDLLGYYIHFRAVSETAVRQYLEREYYHKASGTWKIPWCAVYAEVDQKDPYVKGIIEATCGTIYEE